MSKRALTVVAAAAAVVATMVCLPTAQAAGKPDFQLPAPCGENWQATTYTDHQPSYSVDLNYYPEDTGRPVVASAAGTVSVAGASGGWAGTHVRIDHGGGWTTHYAHLSATSVSAGATVAAGQMIGRVGNTGNSSGAHLHFEQTLNGVGQPAVFNGAAYSYTTRNITSANCGSPEPASPAPLTAVGDLTGDGKPDLLAREGTDSKTLWLYPGLGNGRFGTRIDNGGWGSINQISGVGDVTGDSRADVLAVEKSTGKLWVYPGQTNGHLGARVDNGAGWNDMRIAGTEDLNGDGKGDLLAMETETGKFFLYPGQSNGHFGNRVQIGTGWDAMNVAAGAGDLTGDGKNDVIAVEEATGKLFVYPGLGNGTLGARIESGTNWDTMSSISGAGDYTGDGKDDIVARQNDGKLFVYPGIGAGKLGTRIDNGGGWNFDN
ncbi:VCBS repeat domain-containing M23 family metallopeptidase [Streptomyces sp. ZAF1911]|uniref:VCBS repeat domain-containing M23 family metallopeptidase n=1 Tax=Streptomyces sp. ZAF1911 TaxID=2944129 RepID=UPI00237AABD6|nr:VCBS repeat domain-containing M23 family metallopeptidase [Streptomyces sp. ZAF1911]MDD9377624.1 VCBS repeat domain-containing M23 family metallopeptidase [Streptomyces sp. ZAF1911]